MKSVGIFASLQHGFKHSRSHDIRSSLVLERDCGLGSGLSLQQRSTHVMLKKGIPLGYKISGSAVHSHSLWFQKWRTNVSISSWLSQDCSLLISMDLDYHTILVLTLSLSPLQPSCRGWIWLEVVEVRRGATRLACPACAKRPPPPAWISTLQLPLRKYRNNHHISFFLGLD